MVGRRDDNDGGGSRGLRAVFQDTFAHPEADPIHAAQRAMRPPLRQRFYDNADTAELPAGFAVLLDGKPVRTPAKRVLAAPTRVLAQALAQEWDAQRSAIDPARMPLTRLANSIIDSVAEASAAVADEIGRYLASDLLFYRADAPERLVQRENEVWDPVIAWARDELGARFVLAQGTTHVTQPQEALTAARAAIPNDCWRLGALACITTLTGSALLALALARGRLTVDQAWSAAHVDEDWNIEQWGRDELALARRAYRFTEMKAAAVVLAHLPR